MSKVAKIPTEIKPSNWREVLKTIPKACMSYNNAELILPAEIGTEPGGSVRFVIGGSHQRMLKSNWVNQLAHSYRALGPNFTSEIILATTPETPNIYYIPDGQHRVKAVQKSGKAKTFRAVIYKDLTAAQMVALFELNALRKNTSLGDQLSVYREWSPIYQRYQEILAADNAAKDDTTHIPLPFTILFQGNRKNKIALNWRTLLASWQLAMHTPAVYLNSTDNKRITGYSRDLVLNAWMDDSAVEALDSVTRLVQACEYAAYLTRKRAGGVSVKTLENASEKMYKLFRGAAIKSAATKKALQELCAGPYRHSPDKFYGEAVLRIMLTIRKNTPERHFLKRLPYLMHRAEKILSLDHQAHSMFLIIRDSILDEGNHGARKFKLSYLPR